MKKIFSVLLAACFLSAVLFAAEKSVPAPFTRGVNFSEWLEFKKPDQVDPYYMTKEDFQNVKLMGCDVIRLPVQFELLISGAPDYKIDPVAFEVLDKVVEWSDELKLYVIFDFHNDTGDGTSTSKNIEKIVLAVWQQVAERYSGKGSFICYEIYNEPHYIDKMKWGKIETEVIDLIRSYDADRWIIAGGAEWNSFEALKSLPEWEDSKIIYTFHFYEPMLFTHQGAAWANLGRITGVPFPYEKEKMPKLPRKATQSEIYYLSKNYDYAHRGTEKAVSDFFDEYVKFSKKRNTPVYCGEFGVYQLYADKDDRAEWYRIVTKCLDERGIAHTSWDYYSGFGIFNGTEATKFPEELNREVVEAMGLTVPEKGFNKSSWIENAAASGNYAIYKDGIVRGLKCNYLCDGFSFRKITEDGLTVLEISSPKAWDSAKINFGGTLDFSRLKDSGAKLEFYIRSSEKNPKLQMWFQDSDLKAKYKWRSVLFINSKTFASDGQWHKVSVPLKELTDNGAWDEKTSVWRQSENLFDWTCIDSFVISNDSEVMKEPLQIKDISIVQ